MRSLEGLDFRSGYWDDRRATDRFKEFLVTIHGLDLSLWEQKGYRDHANYRAFSLFEGDRVVATTNLFSMEMMVDGRRRKLGQFSGVGTLPEFRKRGLNRWLTERAIEAGRLNLFDVVGKEIPSLADLHPYLSELPHQEVRFHFMPDKLNVEPDGKSTLEDSNARVYPPFHLPGPDILFPYSSHA